MIIVSLLALATVVTAVLLGIRGAREGILGHKKQSENDLTPLSPLGESADFGEFYIRSTVFLGDSVILGMRDSAVLAKGKETDQIWCGEGGDLQYRQSRRHRPRKRKGDSDLRDGRGDEAVPNYHNRRHQ